MLLSLLACAPTFDETRKDLVGFRLAGMAWDGAPHALIWSGEGAFHSTAPTLDWTVDEGESTVVGLHAESAAGEEDGELVVDADAVVPVVTSSSVVGEEPYTLSLEVEGDSTTRWMASSGTFFETGPHATEWTPGDEPLAAIVALTLDGHGGNTWTWIDVATEGTYLRVDGRLLPTEAAVTDGAWAATLTAADNLAGIVLTDMVPAGETTDIVCGLDPFDATALADGGCGLDEALGARITVEGTAWP